VRTPLATTLLFFALVIAGGVALAVGGIALDPATLLAALAKPHEHTDAATIVWSLRLPRVVDAALVGAELAVAGSFMQALLRNPLVDPYLTGVSSGAGMTIALAIVLGVALPAIPGLGFVGGVSVAILVAVLARRGTQLDAQRLILAGVAISALMSALITMILTEHARESASQEILSWLAGSLAGRDWNQALATLPYAVVGAGLGIAEIPALNVLRLGEGRARTLGVNVVRVQWTLLAAASLLTAAAVTLAGLVGFVGLIVPHVARRLVGPDMRAEVPASAALGAILVVLADATSRSLLAPTEIPLGVLLALIGVPAFLILYLRGLSRAYS
jgi:iron complex transport system permease protein